MLGGAIVQIGRRDSERGGFTSSDLDFLRGMTNSQACFQAPDSHATLR